MTSVQSPTDGIDLNATLESIERQYIAEMLHRTQGNKARAAALLGIKRTCLLQKMRRYGMELQEPTQHKVKEI